MLTIRIICILALTMCASSQRARAQNEDLRILRDSAALESEQRFLNGDSIDEYPASDYFIAVEANQMSYDGDYHFGDSEWEWTLTIKVVAGKVTAKYRYGNWDKKAENWLSFTKTIDSASIEEFVFKGRGFSGVFVKHRTTGQMGLVLTKGHIANAPELGKRRAHQTPWIYKLVRAIARYGFASDCEGKFVNPSSTYVAMFLDVVCFEVSYSLKGPFDTQHQ